MENKWIVRSAKILMKTSIDEFIMNDFFFAARVANCRFYATAVKC